MTQEQLDAQCVQWNHVQRKVTFCPNPSCPGKVPEDWLERDDVPDITEELEPEQAG